MGLGITFGDEIIDRRYPAWESVAATLRNQFISFLDAKPQTVKAYAAGVRAFFEYLGERNITRPAAEDVLAYKRELVALYKPSTVSLYMTAVRLLFRFAAQRSYYPNIADHVKGAKISREHKRDYLTGGQVKAVLATADRSTLAGKRDYALIALMVTAGLRDVEVSRANIEDLRPSGDQTALYVQGKGRDEKADAVVVPPDAERAIREYLKARGAADQSEPLFAGISNHGRGGRLTTRSISRICKTRMQAAGMASDRITAHSLRHTAITLALLAGRTAQEAQTFARHADISTTMIYAHNIEETTARAACGNAVAAAIF